MEVRKARVCWKCKGNIQSLPFIVFVILSSYIRTDKFACGQSVRGVYNNQRRNVVEEMSKLQLATTDKATSQKITTSEKIMSKIRERNKHNIVKKSSSLTDIVDSPEPNHISFYSNMFYEEQNEPSPSTVSPFGKQSLKFIVIGNQF